MKICSKCNAPNPDRSTACYSCGTPMPGGTTESAEPRRFGRLLIGSGATLCLGILVAALILARCHFFPAQALGSTAETRSIEQSEPAAPEPAETEEPPEVVEAVPVIPKVEDPVVPTHKPDFKNPLDVLAEQSILRHGDTQGKSIALTFDDGPHPVYTRRLLEILDRYGIKASFFVVGKVAAKYPDTVRAIFDAGHVVGNHTWDHQRLATLSEPQCEAEWEKCSDTLYDILGGRPLYCRPPGCNMNANVVLAAAHHTMTTVLYTVNPGDYTLPGKDAILNRILRKVKGGDIILLHDGVEETIEVLPRLIEALQARGYDFITVDQMDRATWMPKEPARADANIEHRTSNVEHRTPETQNLEPNTHHPPPIDTSPDRTL